MTQRRELGLKKALILQKCLHRIKKSSLLTIYLQTMMMMIFSHGKQFLTEETDFPCQSRGQDQDQNRQMYHRLQNINLYNVHFIKYFILFY